jgi:hypothetical protein
MTIAKLAVKTVMKDTPFSGMKIQIYNIILSLSKKLPNPKDERPLKNQK